MSIIRDDESFNSTRWIYTSAVMARRLQDVIINKRVELTTFENGDIRCAMLLFNSLQEAARESSIDKNLAQVIGLCPISSFKKGETKASKKQKQSITPSLEELAGFVKQLENPRSLGKDEVTLANQLRELFVKIYQDGGTTAYERGVALEFSQ